MIPVILIFDRPLVFWLGLIVLPLFVLQIIIGILMTSGGKYQLLKYHKLNALILSILVIIHALFGISLYINLHL